MKNYCRVAERYARDVVAGRVIACKWVKLACRRHLNDLKRKTTARWPYYFSEWWGNDVCDFAEKMPHVEGEWDSPTVVLERWQIFILVSVFGWRRRIGKEVDEETDPRRFNTAYIEVARKNAKSFKSSIVGIYCLSCEGENGPQVKVAATTGDQARVVFDVAKEMVARTGDLREAFELEARANSIPCLRNGGHMKAINARASTQDGLNPHCSIIDELHAHKDRSLFDRLKSARGARKNPLSWYITTAGYNTEGVCYEQRTLVTKVLERIITLDHYFGIIFTLDDDDLDDDADIFNERNWKKPNPNLGVSVDLKELRDYAKEVKASPQSVAEFKTKRLNLWLNAANPWLDVAKWRRCGVKDFWAALERRCLGNTDGPPRPGPWIGADLANRDDLAAVALVFVDDNGLPWVTFRFYLPEEVVKEHAETTGAHYQQWADEGHLILTPGVWTDYNRIEQDIRADWERYRVQSAVFDVTGSAQMASSLGDDGLETVIMPKSARNFTDPCNEIESRVRRRLIRHDGNPVMTWNVSNAVARRRADGSLLPQKENEDSPLKIDGVDGLVNGMSRFVVGQEGGSVYEERGIVWVG